jgi:CrcB protein
MATSSDTSLTAAGWEAAKLDNALLVGAGGFIGSILRYIIGGLVQAAVPSSIFPYGTFIVNITGCFIIGLVSQLSEAQGALGPGARAFVVVGVLGGYTTFSSFANETVNLMRDGQHLASATNVAGEVMLGLCAVWLGRLTVQLIWR